MNKNKRNMIKLLALLLSLIFGFSAQAQFRQNVSKAGTTAGNFLEIGIGARAMAMGGAFVARANDISSLYWNPAGLPAINNFQMILNHVNWLADINFDYFGIAKTVPGIGVMGLSIAAITMDDMQVRTVGQPDGTGESFSASDLSIQFSFARQVTSRFSIGFSSKYIFEQIWHTSASAFAFDFGTIYRTAFNGMTIGMSISNFGSSMKMSGRDTQIRVDIDPISAGNNDNIRGSLETDRFSLPLIFRFGIMMPIQLSEQQEIFIMADGLHPNNNYESVNIGAEYTLYSRYSIRGGYKSLFLDDTEEGFTLGAGFKTSISRYLKLNLDYAYQDFGRLTNTQFFTLQLEF